MYVCMYIYIYRKIKFMATIHHQPGHSHFCHVVLVDLAGPSHEAKSGQKTCRVHPLIAGLLTYLGKWKIGKSENFTILP